MTALLGIPLLAIPCWAILCFSGFPGHLLASLILARSPAPQLRFRHGRRGGQRASTEPKPQHDPGNQRAAAASD